jgi:hypothetical protein
MSAFFVQGDCAKLVETKPEIPVIKRAGMNVIMIEKLRRVFMILDIFFFISYLKKVA